MCKICTKIQTKTNKKILFSTNFAHASITALKKSISKIFSLVDTILIIPGGEFLDDFELKKFHEDFLNFLG